MAVLKARVVTGTRAEYGILRPLLQRLAAHESFDLGLIVTGMHLSERFGSTVNEIESDGFPVTARVPLDLDDDSEAAMTAAAAQALQGFGEALARERPDLLLVLGDRIEVLCAATAALLARVPVVHLHGGEVTLGAVDDAIRHAVTKMSWLHLTATEQSRRRVIQLGEDPGRVFTTGALGVDNAISLPKLSREQLESDLGSVFGERTAVVTYHPVTLEERSAGAQIEELMRALSRIPDLSVVFTAPNADAGNRAVFEALERFTGQNGSNSRYFVSLGATRYLSLVEQADVVVGNSSSGIIEAPSLGTPTVDIGDRQAGRERGPSVLHCGPVADEIEAAINEALSERVQRLAEARENPYGDGHAAEKAMAVLEREAPRFGTLKKEFYDIGGGGQAT